MRTDGFTAKGLKRATADAGASGGVVHCARCEYAQDVGWLGEHRLYCMYRAERGGDVDLVLDQVSEDDYCSKGRM